MANEDRRVDLVVRAKDVEAKPLAELLKLIDQLGKGLDDLAKDGGPATRTITELTNTVKDFSTVARELASRRALVESFLKIRDGAVEAADRLGKAKTALAAYKAGLEGVEKTTKDQRDALKLLQREFNNAEKQAKGFVSRQASAEESLSRIGVAAADAAQELEHLASVEARVDQLSLQAERNARGRDQAVRDLKAQTKATADLAAAQLTLARAEQAEADRLSTLEQAGRADLARRGEQALRAEQQAIKEAADLSRRLADQRIADAKRAEQAEADRLAIIQRAAQAEQALRGKNALAGELAALREAQLLEERLAASRADAAAAEKKRQADLLAFDKAIRAQKEAAIAAQRQEADELRKAASAASGTVAEVQRLVDAFEKLRATPAVRSLAQQIGELANPAKQAAFSLEALSNGLPEIERRQRQAANSTELSATETKQLAQDYRTLEQALTSLGRVAAAVDAFRKQRDELIGVEAAIAQARAELERYTRSAAQGLGGQSALEGIAQQQQLIEQLSREFARLSPRVADSERMLRSMGVAAEKLEASERELLATTGRVRAAFDQAGDATSRLGQATQKGATQLGGFHNESRTALTLYQRIRGQVLSLTAAYVGLFGVIQEGQRTVDATKTLQGINSRLGVAFGDDPKTIAAELEYVRKVSDRLGLSLSDAAAGYSKFAIAGKAANLTGNETRFIFEKFSEVSRVMNLSVEDTNGVFRALEQILSKGKVQAEELRGQLGDRLSGAFYQFAQSLGLSTAELDKLLEAGKVPADFLLLFAKQFGDTVKNQVAPASKTFASEMARLNTALFDFRNTVAEGGFLETLTKLVVQLTAFLKSAEGAQAAQVLAELFVIAGDAAVVLLGVLKGVVQGLQSLMSAAAGVKEALADLFDTEQLPDFVKALLEAVDAAKALGVALVYLGVAGGINTILTRLTSVVVAFTGSVSAATLAVRLLGITLKSLLWPVLVLLVGVDVFRWAERNFSWVAKVSIVLEGLFQKLEAIASFLAKPAGPIGLAKAFDELKKKLREIDAVQEEGFNKIVRKEQGIQTITRPDASGRMIIHDPSAKGTGGRGATGPGANDALLLDAERENALREQAKKLANVPDKGAIAQARKDLADATALVKSVESATAALEVSAAKKSADDATEAARAIDLQYAGLIENIHKLGTVSEAELKKIRVEAAKAGFNVSEAANVAELQKSLLARVEAAKATLKQEAADKLAAKQAKEKVDALISERDALIELEQVRAKIDPALQAQAQQNELRILAEYRDRIVAAAEAAALLADKEGKVAEAAKLRSVALQAGARGTDRDAKRAQLNDRQTEIQQKTAERDAQIGLVDAQLATRTIDDVQAQEQRLAIMERYNATIAQSAVSARALAESLGDSAMVANIDALLLKLTQTDEQSLKIAETFKTQFADALVNAAMSGAEALGQILIKGGDINDVFDAVGKTFADFAAQFLQQVAAMILQTYALAAAQAILTAVGGPSLAGAGGSGTVSGGAGFVARHGGGTVGAWGMTRQVSAEVFEGAQRFHGGGLPGLRPDEVPTILQKGEEVLSKNDPRNILNGGGATGQPANIKAVLVDDSRSALEAMASSSGETVWVSHLKKNVPTIRRMLQGS